MDAGYISTIMFNSSMLSINFTIMAKSLKLAPLSRGIVSGGFVFTSSLGIIMTDTLGQVLFDKADTAPFVMCFCFLICNVLLIVIFKCLNQTNI